MSNTQPQPQVISFNDWKQDHMDPPAHQKFPCAENRVSLALSNECLEGLNKLTTLFNCESTSQNKSITKLLELIGLNCLYVTLLPNLSLEGRTSHEAYNDGKQDAIEKREYNFQLLYKGFPREFEEAYRRGYLEMKEIE